MRYQIFTLALAMSELSLAGPVVTLAAPTPSPAPASFAGDWAGTISQKQNPETFLLTAHLTANDATHFHGTSRITDKQLYYGVMTVQGSADARVLHYAEQTITQQKTTPNFRWCVKKGDLVLSDDGKQLVGELEDPGCNAGLTILRRVEKKH